MYPLMYLFGKNSMPDVDNLLTSFYQLDDEARQEVVETILPQSKTIQTEPTLPKKTRR